MAKKYRVGIIGRTGKGDYGHDVATVWTKIDEAEIVALADEDDKGRADRAGKLGVTKTYADYREMLDKERPHFVSVAMRWLDPHRDMVLACAEKGCSIFLEKPMCQDLVEADEMVKACERHHVKLAIAHQTRYSPKLQVVRDLINDGKIGDVLEVRGRGKEDKRGGGEDLMVLGTHVFDLMRFLCGDPRWCYARVMQDGKMVTKAEVRDGAEGIGPLAGDWISAGYGFDRGVTGTFNTHRAKDGVGQRFGLWVYGSRGVITMTTGYLGTMYLIEDPTWSSGRSKATPQEITSVGVGKPEPLKDGSALAGNIAIVKDLIEAVEKDRQPKGSIYDGRAALEMILAVYESHRVKGPVEIPLKNRKHPLTML